MLKISKEYIAVIEKEKGSDYGVIFPDFPGCISSGSTLEETKNMAQEALQFHIDGMLEDKEELPHPSTLDDIKKKHPNSEAFLVISSKIPSVAKRINITIDEKLLRKLDKFLEKNGDNRSHFFAQSIKSTLLRHN